MPRPSSTALKRYFSSSAGTDLLLIVISCGIVLWLRLMPFSLDGLPDAAERIARSTVAEKIAQETSRTPQDVAETEIDGWIRANSDKYQAYKLDLSVDLRDESTFVGDDSKTYPYLGGYDGYYWLRAAENILAKGSPCDSVVNSECRDDLSLAPVGTKMIYGESLHAWALARLHRLVSAFAPGLPLSTTAMILPLALSLLGTVPAYYLGVRFGGSPGGFVAAITIASNPVYLGRSIYGDTDIWNVVLPLFIAWFIVNALDAAKRICRVGLPILSGLLVSLHAAIWSGWPFMVAIIAAGLVSGMLLETVQLGRREAVKKDAFAACAKSAGILALFLGATALSVWFAFANSGFVTLPDQLTRLLQANFLAPTSAGGPASGLWPSPFWSVAELLPVTRAQLTRDLGGPWLAVATLGLYCMFLRSRPLERVDIFPILWIAFCSINFTLQPSSNHLVTITAVALPVLYALLSRFERDAVGETSGLVSQLIVAVWFLASLYQTQSGNRFLLLMVASLGISAAALTGRVVDEIGRRRNPGALTTIIIWAIVASISLPFLTAGYRPIREALPAMNSAWWNSLQQLRSSPADSIISTGWAHGHWAKFVADRRVTTDGATIGTNANYWLSRALGTSDERESVGLLRMLNCGSDATPRPEAAQGAFGLLKSVGFDARDAYRTLLELAVRDRIGAATMLDANAVSSKERVRIDRASHCRPPDSYLLLSDHYLRQAPIWAFGLWDYRKAELVAMARTGQINAASDALLNEYSMTLDESETFISDAQKAAGAQEIDRLAMPTFVPNSIHWHHCHPKGSEIHCPIALIGRPPYRDFFLLTYRDGDEASVSIHFRSKQSGSVEIGTPGRVFLAKANRLEESTVPRADFPELAVLIDPEQSTVFVGSPILIRSMLAQLVLLDGRYLQRFEKINEQRATTGETVTTWKVRFPD